MNILEKDIEDLIWEGINYHSDSLEKTEFPYYGGYKYFRQPNLGSYGIADLVAAKIFKDSRHIKVIIYELKKEDINIDTYLQAVKYSIGIKKMFKKLIPKYYFEFNFILIGKSVETKGNFCFLADTIHNLSLYTYSLDLFTGLQFNMKYGYHISSASIPNPKLSISDIKTLLYHEQTNDRHGQMEETICESTTS